MKRKREDRLGSEGVKCQKDGGGWLVGWDRLIYIRSIFGVMAVGMRI